MTTDKKPWRAPAVESVPRCSFIASGEQYHAVLGQRCLREEHSTGFHVFSPENVRVVCVSAEAARG